MKWVSERTYRESQKTDQELLENFPKYLDGFLAALRRQSHRIAAEGETWLDALTRTREEMRVELRTVQLQETNRKKNHDKLMALAEKRRLGIETIRTRHTTLQGTAIDAPNGGPDQGQEQ